MPENTPNDAETDIHTGFERSIRQIEKRIETTKSQLRSDLREIGINPSEPLTEVSINPQKFMRRSDGYGYHRAKKAKSKQTNIESLERRLETLKHRHEQKREQLKESDSE